MTNGSPNTIRWLHLSDFHVGKDDYGERKLFKEILKHVREQRRCDVIPDLVFITGDVAYSGEDKQFKTFYSEFLQPFYALVGEQKRLYTFFVPGNHDVIRKIHKYFDREEISEDPCFFDPTLEGLEKRKIVIPRFKAYTKNPSMTPVGWINTQSGCYANPVDIRGNSLGVFGVNTAWLSKNEDDRNKLTPGSELLKDAFDNSKECNLNIVLGHHPIEWFDDDQASRIKTILGNHNSLYLHGHWHKVRANIDGDGFLCIQSGAAFLTRDDDEWKNGLLWAELDLSRFVLRLQPRRWDPVELDWPPIGMDLPEKRRVNGTDWWEFPLPNATKPRVTYPPSKIHNQNGIQPKYNDFIGFAGRKKEINEFYQFLTSQDLVLNYHGVSGIGKSWLLNHLLTDLPKGRISSEYIPVNIDCKEINVNLPAFMRSVARYMGESRLPNYFKLRNKYSQLDDDHLSKPLVDDLFDRLFSDLQTISKNERIIIFLDSFEKFQEKKFEGRFINAFTKLFSGHSRYGLKVVVGGLQPIRASRGWISFRSIEIKSFSREDLEEFAEKNLDTTDDAVISYLKDDWNGNPLELGQLVGRYTKENGSTSSIQLSQLRNMRSECIIAADSEIMKRLKERLGGEDTEALFCCAVPKWCDAHVLRVIANSDFPTSRSQFERLKLLTWLMKPLSSGNGFEIHEKYRKPILRNLIQGDRELFSIWSKHYYEYLNIYTDNRVTTSEISREIESICHLMAFNEDDALLQYNDLRYRLERRNRLDLMTWLQDEIEVNLQLNPNISSYFRHWARYGRTMIYYMNYDDDLVINEYEQMLKDPALDDFFRGRIIQAKGNLLGWQKRQWEIAKACSMEAIKIWEILIKENIKSPGVTRDDVLKSLAEAYKTLARIDEIQGNLVEGMNHLKSALDAYRQCDTLGPSYGLIFLWMGRILRFLGKWKEAHYQFNEAEEFFNTLFKKAKSGDVRLGKRIDEIKDANIQVLNARAALWKEEGLWEEAKKVMEQVISFYNEKPEESRNKEDLGIALIDLGDILLMEGNFIKAKWTYEKTQENLEGSNINKGYPLLGLAEIAKMEGNDQIALNYLSQAEENFEGFRYIRKKTEAKLCRAKIIRKVNLNEALKILEEAWEAIRKTQLPYIASSILIELSDLTYEYEGNSERCKDYHMQALALASQEQGLFTGHMTSLRFLDGRIAGEKEPLDALPAFVESFAWAVKHNILTLERTVSNCKTWLHDHIRSRIELALDNEEMRKRKAEVVLRESKEKALLTLPEKLKPYFKNAVKELKNSINCESEKCFL